jgi:hypothetical protein
VFVESFVGETDNVYKTAIRKLDGYFLPKLNVAYERHVFRQLKQEDETVAQFVSRLKQQGLNCEFGDEAAKNEQIRDQVVDACKSSNLRRKLLQKGTALTLDNVLELARAMEAVDLQMKRIEGKSNGEVNRVGSKDSVRKKSKPFKKPDAAKQNRGGSKFACYRCGREGHFSKDPECPAKNATCSKCKFVGHFAPFCKTKQGRIKSDSRDAKQKGKVNQVDEEDKEYAFLMGKKNNSLDSGMVDTNIGGVNVRMLIDSGSTANVVDRDTWRYMKKQRVECISDKTSKRLYPYGTRDPLSTLGTFSADVEIGDKKVNANFIVIDCAGRPLLGKDTSEQLKVLKLGPNIGQTEQCNQIKNESVMNIADIKRAFPECFNGIGKLKDYQATIHVDPNVEPVAQSTRRIPFSMRDKLEIKIKSLIKEDIIEPVEGPTPWVSPVVIVPKKNDDIRLCVDMRRANKAVIRERHPIPTVDEILDRMNGSCVFTKLDLKSAFHQIELDEKSRVITTFSTHLGLFRYKRLMFGISSAPEKFQHIIQQVVAECEGCENIHDDLVVHGRDQKEHDHRLLKVLKKLSEKG